MNRTVFIWLSALWLLAACSPATEQGQIQREADFNFGWKFNLAEQADAAKPEFDDAGWREVNLPHDWSIEFPYDTLNGEGCVGYLPGGTAWYRKHFKLDYSPDEKVYVYFDGVYNNSELWINGKKLGQHPYGYSPFYYDLTPFVTNGDAENVLAVKVDRTRFADSRWYTGSGIYRNVKLVKVNRLHIPIWGTFVTTPKLEKETATVAVDIALQNDFGSPKQAVVKTEIVAPNGNVVANTTTEVQLKADQQKKVKHEMQVKSPVLWDIDDPQLYVAQTKVLLDGKLIDQYDTRFGMRNFRFDAEKGFFLNGRNLKIKGVCLHHDGGIVGAAVPKDVWRRRFQGLKDAGCNAIRVSHNPASEEFLQLCDEMGFLVQDEFFDEWDYPKDKRLNMNERHDDYITRGYTEHFQEWAQRDLEATLLAHRNHPSIFQWSIGNEIEWTYERNAKATGFFGNMNWSGNYFWSQPPYSPQKIKQVYDSLPAGKYDIGKTAQQLATWTRALDSTRPVVANCILPSASFETGYADALDVVGFSYRRVMYDYAKKHYPNKVIMGTENVAQWHEWKAIIERDFVAGTFLWTGIDYMGERHQRKANTTRYKGIASGILDFAGFKKTSFYMMRSLWSNEPTLYMASQTAEKSKYKVADGKVVEKKPGYWQKVLWIWHELNEHWNYNAGEAVIVEIISNSPEVELFLNGKSLGTKKLADFEDRIYKWAVPFEAGKLVAKAHVNGKAIETSIATAGKPASIKLAVDKTTLNADGYAVAHVVAQLYDKDGNKVIADEALLDFVVDGAVTLLGVDNGHDQNFMKYQSNQIKTHKGRCLLIVQATTKAGAAQITATANKMTSNTLTLKIE